MNRCLECAWAECARCRTARVQREQAERVKVDSAFYARTGGLCGGCGQPGTWCQCQPSRPCGCAELHIVGSGIGVDPADVFAETPLSDQAGLFDV